MTLAAVHQFHSGAAFGDAITQQMLDLQRLLRRAGYPSDVYAEHIADDVADRIKPIETFVEEPSTALLVHHSMGHSAFEIISSLCVPKITVFHSITPARFFDDAWFRERVYEGFAQLRSLARQSVAGIADSNHNRLQMYDAGFDRVAVIPVRTDYSAMRALPRSHDPSRRDWLFVGRLAPNKNQLELVRAFAAYRSAYPEGHLHLVGDDSIATYTEAIRREISSHGLDHHVTVHGKVSAEDLLARYRDAAAFVCLSQHEGFGVPLLEAMAAGVPVIARDEAAVAETMGGAGLLVRDPDAEMVAATVRLMVDDPDLRRRVIADQDRRMARIEDFDTLSVLERTLALAEPRACHPPVSVQIQGPFETSYSLATLNRELALELATGPYDVSVYATEGPGDYTPDPADLRTHPDAALLHAKAIDHRFPDVAIRQMFPPRVHDSTAGMTFQYFGWEESRVPPNYVDDFNRHLAGVGVMSTYVRDVLVDEGVTVPVSVVGVGVHRPDPEASADVPGLLPSDRFTFLHVSSAFPRKGVDVLLRAYFESFTKHDDVRLVLKTFPNPHNEVDAQLARLVEEFPEHPEIVWLDVDLDRAAIDGLYRAADVYVHPARGEGFGLPVAEAMLASIPVISTAAGGLADFVNPQTATVVGHTIAPAMTHLTLPGSTWFEPDLDDLKASLRAAANGEHQDIVRVRVEAARQLIAETYSWTAVADRWTQFIDAERNRRAGTTIAVVSTFNSRCGVAEYCASLYTALGPWANIEVLADRDATLVDELDDVGIQRVWNNYRSAPVDDLLAALDDSDADLVHVQYNFGFFELAQLARLVRRESARRPTVVTLHRAQPLDVDGRVESLGEIVGDLNRCAAIIVHQASDRAYLDGLGVTAPVEVLPIGSEPARTRRPIERRSSGTHALTLGTYGFLLPHKGLLSLLEATDILRSRGVDAGVIACCAIHPDPSSSAHHERVTDEIRRLGLERAVRLVTDYLPNDESMALLDESDIIVLPYHPTSESSSAALRSVLPLGRPIVTSDIAIFEDARDVVRQVSSPVSPTELADELESLWRDDLTQRRLSEAARRRTRTTSWNAVARRTRDLYLSALASRGLRPAGGDRSDATLTTV